MASSRVQYTSPYTFCVIYTGRISYNLLTNIKQALQLRAIALTFYSTFREIFTFAICKAKIDFIGLPTSTQRKFVWVSMLPLLFAAAVEAIQHQVMSIFRLFKDKGYRDSIGRSVTCIVVVSTQHEKISRQRNSNIQGR